MSKFLRFSSLLVSLIVLSPQLPIQAQIKVGQPNFSPSLLARVTFTPSPDKPRPTGPTGGGASRRGPGCTQEERGSDTVSSSQSDTPLTLIVPSTVAALTTAERPTFFAYVPKSSGKKMLLSLRNQQGDYQYQTVLNLPGSGGIVQVQMPENAPPLALDQQYQWSLVISCGATLRPDSPSASGYIERVNLPPSLTQQLAGQNPLQQATLLGENGIWYDTLANLAIAKQQNPTDPEMNQSWQEILTSVGLESVATAPLVSP